MGGMATFLKCCDLENKELDIDVINLNGVVLLGFFYYYLFLLKSVRETS